MGRGAFFTRGATQIDQTDELFNPLCSAITGGPGKLRGKVLPPLDENASELDSLHWRVPIINFEVL